MIENRNSKGNLLDVLVGLVSRIFTYASLLFIMFAALFVAQVITDKLVKKYPILAYFSPIKFCFLGIWPLLCIGMIWADPAHWAVTASLAVFVIAVEIVAVAGLIKLHKRHLAKKSTQVL